LTTSREINPTNCNDHLRTENNSYKSTNIGILMYQRYTKR
jgi:hypothetical protein